VGDDPGQRGGTRLGPLARSQLQPVPVRTERAAEGPERARHLLRHPSDARGADAPGHEAGQGGRVVAGFDVTLQRRHRNPFRAHRASPRRGPFAQRRFGAIFAAIPENSSELLPGARAATAEEGELLGEPEGAPLLTMQRTAFDDTGRAVEYGSHLYRASRYAFEFQLLVRS